MIIDSHAHLNFEAFKDDYKQIIDNCEKEKIWMINVGAQLQTSRRAVEIAEEFEKGVYAAVGLHPIHVSGSDFHPEAFNIDNYRSLIKSSKKIVGIGETGLDFFHSDKNIENQKKVFIKHVNLAKEFNLPLIIHSRNSKDGSRDAYNEILEILRDVQDDKLRGVIHCFGGTPEQALAFLKQGFFIGFTGIVTFDKTGQIAEVVRNLPLDVILVETDCPYLAPDPYRGERNRPEYVKYIAKKIAEIREIDYNKVEKQAVINTTKLFNL